VVERCGGEGDKVDKSTSEAAPGLGSYCLSVDDSSSLGDLTPWPASNSTVLNYLITT